MSLPRLCIRQPVLAVVLSLILLVLGMVGFQRLGLRFFPKLVMPIVTVRTYYSGASPELMESQVTTPIENALAGIDNVELISSSSWTGGSNITVQFRLGGNFESEAASVRDKVAGVRQRLPTDASPPYVTVGTKGNAIIELGVTDASKSSADIREYVSANIQPYLRPLKGVGAASIIGSSGYAMRIWLSADKMAAREVTVANVKSAILANNIYFPAGYVEGRDRNYSVISNTRLKNPEAFGNIVVKQVGNSSIYLKDVANIKLGNSSLHESPMYINGKPGIEIQIKPLQSANPIDVANRVKEEVRALQKNLPPGMAINTVYDASIFLKSSIDETFKAIGEAVILVMAVVLLFLGSLRAAFIPIVTIPVSLIGAFTLIYLFGFSINIMSLLGIVLAIGLVVDDAIVMLENIHRHMEHGLSAMEASLKGSSEILSAVVAMGVTLAAVYAPIGLVQGFSAALFQEFAFTLAGAVVLSAFVALSLSPMMCSKLLVADAKEGRYAKWLDHIFHRMTKAYHRGLSLALAWRHIVLLFLVGLAVVGVLLFKSLPSEFIPQEDYGVMNISISAPSGATLSYTEKYMHQIEAILRRIPEVQSTLNQINPGSANITVTMKPWGERTRSVEAIIAAVNPKLAAIPGVDALAYVPDIVDYGETGADITYNFTTPRDYDTLLTPINKMMAALKNYPGVVDVHTNLKFDSQQYAITINRPMAAALGVNLQDIADTISAMMSGNHWTGANVQSGNRSYPIIVQMQQADLKNFSGVKKLYVAGSAPTDPSLGTPMVPLANLINLEPTIQQGSLTHLNRMRSGYITARLAPGVTESDVVNTINQLAPSILTSDVQGSFTGKALQFIQSAGSMTGIVVMSFIFIYLVLSAQFGSFLDPFIILFAVPFSVVGALLFLTIVGGTINLYSQIGMVTLIGMISKHGILITQFINKQRTEGKALHEAIIDGASIRLRPVLMTTAAMVFGTLPLAFATGPGSVGRMQIGWVIVGGLLCGTFFSLVVVPVVYSYLGRFKTMEKQHDTE